MSDENGGISDCEKFDENKRSCILCEEAVQYYRLIVMSKQALGPFGMAIAMAYLEYIKTAYKKDEVTEILKKVNELCEISVINLN